MSPADEPQLKFSVIHGENEEVLTYNRLNLGDYFDLSIQDKNGVIVITECGPKPFKKLIQMLYNNDIRLDSCADALDFIGVSEKLKCPKLFNKCKLYLNENYKGEFVFKIYEYGLWNDPNLAKKCLEHVHENAQELLFGKAFHEASIAALFGICSDETMVNQHLDLLVNALIGYAKAKVHKEAQYIDNVRKDISPAVRRLPFEKLDVENFDGIEYLLTMKERFEIQKRKSNSL